MALPQKIVEQLGRSPVKTPGWSGRLLMFSSTIFLISVGAYIGLIVGYKPYLETQIKKLDDQILKLTAQVSPKDQEEIIKFYGQIVNLRKLLGTHTLGSRFLTWLEQNTQANVYFTNLSVNLQGGQVSLTGRARAPVDVAEQNNIFLARTPEVSSVTMGGVGLEEKTGLWGFTFTLILNPAYFQAGLASPTAENTEEQQ